MNSHHLHKMSSIQPQNYITNLLKQRLTTENGHILFVNSSKSRGDFTVVSHGDPNQLALGVYMENQGNIANMPNSSYN